MCKRLFLFMIQMCTYIEYYIYYIQIKKKINLWLNVNFIILRKKCKLKMPTKCNFMEHSNFGVIHFEVHWWIHKDQKVVCKIKMKNFM